MQSSQNRQVINISKKKQYNLAQRIFLCKCFYKCQADDESLFTLENRKDKVKNLIQFNISDSDENSLVDSFSMLIKLYLTDDVKNVIGQLKWCRLNPNFAPKCFQRDDLEFYVPQLVNFLVFHTNVEEDQFNQMQQFMLMASYTDFFLGHLLYFYLQSIKQSHQGKTVTNYPEVDQLQQEISENLQKGFQDKILLAYQMVLAIDKPERIRHISKFKQNAQEEKKEVQTILKAYGTQEWESSYLQKQITIDLIDLNNYNRIYNEDKFQMFNQEGEQFFIQHDQQQQQEGDGLLQNQDKNSGFFSTINFFDDLIYISQELLRKADPKIVALRTELRKINEQLPAAVYVPFFYNSIRNYVVLNIVAEESKVFSTKERSPFYICLELYRPEEEFEQAEETVTKKQYRLENQIANDQLVWGYDILLSQPLTVNNINPITKLKASDLQLSGQNSNIATKNKKPNGFTSKSQILVPQHRITINSESNEANKNESSKNTSFTLDKKNGVLDLDEEKSDISSNNYYNNNNNNIEIGMNVGNGKIQNIVLKKKQSKSEIGSTFSQFLVAGISCVYDAPKVQGRVVMNSNSQYEENIVEQKINLGPTTLNLTLTDSLIDKDDKIKQRKTETSSIENQNIELDISQQEFAFQMFGESEQQIEDRIRKKSPYGKFKSWKLVHMIIKTGDNLKQEQFAIQLIYQFQQIFKSEGLNLILRPYEIISVGPQAGIVEMVKGSITIDGLKRQLNFTYKRNYSLCEFFRVFYKDKLEQAQKNFCSSLAAYSLVCYFLQIKDRHNGNILLHRDGYIIHIDFGFFLSNAPGRGIEIEKNVPFKLMREYVEVLGGVDSPLFERFRRYFALGFSAAKRNQDKIMILAKMLYSGHGYTLPCFEKGEQAITELERRFNPPNINIDAELNIFCQELINQSLDNWRARWYDKYQYFCQGIFY